MSDLRKLDTLLHKAHNKGPSGTKVPSLGICRCIISFSKVAQQILHNYPFSQINNAPSVNYGCTFNIRNKLK